MHDEGSGQPPLFPPWTNRLRPALGVGVVLALVYATGLIYYGASPRTTDVGYMPVQPVPYSHALHAGKLGMDCRYCHTEVERAAQANVPPTQTCMNCHTVIRADSPRLELVRRSYETGLPIEWVRVHNLPDFVFFDHSAHVRRGVGCVSCHGRIDTMEVVYRDQPLSMSWCLDCHRNPEPHLRPLDQITNMTWKPPGGDAVAEGRRIREELNIQPSEDCTTCHR